MFSSKVQVIALLGCAAYVSGQSDGPDWTTSPFSPHALPLAVRTPYLNTWLEQGRERPSLNDVWPRLWDNQGITGWYVSVVVDGQGYVILGGANVENVKKANQTAAEFTSTRTSVLLDAGPMQINASFISPVEPLDLVRQSLPFSYLAISATSTDGSAHDLRIYSDISGEFVAGNASQVAQWSHSEDSDYIVLSMELQTPQQYAEITNHAQDAIEYYALKKISGTTVSWAITEDTVNRANAANTSISLGNRADETPRSVSTNWPTLGIAVDWGNVERTQEPAVWAIGVVRSPSIQYRTPDGSIEELFPYFLSNYSDGIAATKAFLDDFPRAAANAAALDVQLSSAGREISEEYANLLALTTRQAFSSLEITLSGSVEEGLNTTDVKVFLKNMGGAGSDIISNALGVSTVDTLYAAFPIFLYFNPDLAGYLLSPLLECQNSPTHGPTYAARSIGNARASNSPALNVLIATIYYTGSAFPNATAGEDIYAPEYGVEESANMLIMTLAYSQRSGDGTLIGKHYALLRKWADFLANTALHVRNQRPADYVQDSEISEDHTNLALKGIIGIASMAKISEIVGNHADRESFNNTAISYLKEWQDNAVASDDSHVNLVYGNDNTSVLLYNLYVDRLLQLNLVSSFVYDVVTTFYTNTVDEAPYGLPLDSGQHERTTANALLFAASTVTNSATRDKIISQVHAYASANLNNSALPTTYNPITGTTFGGRNSGRNSPASGATFALLALNTTIRPVSVPVPVPDDGLGLTTFTSPDASTETVVTPDTTDTPSESSNHALAANVWAITATTLFYCILFV